MRLSEALRYFKGPFPKVRSAMRGYRPERDMQHHPFPTMVQVQTVNACNAACIMCPYGRTPDSQAGGRMDDALWDKIVDEVASQEGVDTFIPMLQDEPFLDPTILEKVRVFKEKTNGGVKAELVTHGGLLTADVIEQICRSPLDTLTISVDSIHREVYEKIRIGLHYDEVMSNIQKLIDARPKVRIAVRMVRQTFNRNEVEEFVSFWRARGVEAMAWDIGNRSGAVQQYDALQVSHENAPWYAMVGNILLERFTPHCPVPFYSASILHNGDLLACGFDWLHESVVGNVRQQTISEVWNSEKMREMRHLHFQKQAEKIDMCKRCSIWQKTWAPARALRTKEVIK